MADAVEEETGEWRKGGGQRQGRREGQWGGAGSGEEQCQEKGQAKGMPGKGKGHPWDSRGFSWLPWAALVSLGIPGLPVSSPCGSLPWVSSAFLGLAGSPLTTSLGFDWGFCLEALEDCSFLLENKKTENARIRNSKEQVGWFAEICPPLGLRFPAPAPRN